MFSTHHRETWDAINALADEGAEAPGDPASFAPFDPAIARLLWHPALGRGGDLDRAVLARAEATKERRFGRRVFPISPLYMTSFCQEGCLYCNYRAGNGDEPMPRRRLSDADLKQETALLADEKGLRTIELVYAADPQIGADDICRHVEVVRRHLDRLGGGVVGINAEPLDEAGYRRLANAGTSFVALWVETYDRERYGQLHPGATPKTDLDDRLDAYERMIAGGIQHIGLGVLSGLADWRRDWAMLMHHEAHLRRACGVTPAILGIPRLKPAARATLRTTPFIPTDQELRLAVALHGLFAPETLPFVNTREGWDLCLDLARGGGCLFTFNCSTIPGGYTQPQRGDQFPTGSFDAPASAAKMRALGFDPVFDWSP